MKNTKFESIFDRLLNPLQVQKMFNISRATEIEWRNKGILPKPMYMNRRVYYKGCDIENLLKNDNKQPNKSVIVLDKNQGAKKFGKWVVSINGDMVYDYTRYVIGYETLEDDDWLIHMLTKDWVDFNEFMPAYFQALKNAGIKNLNILIYH